MAVLTPRFVDEYAQLFRYGIPPEMKVPEDTSGNLVEANASARFIPYQSLTSKDELGGITSVVRH